MSAEEKKAPELSYFVSEKPPFAVVTFIGAISKPTLSVLEDSQKDLSERADTLFVIVFREVTTVDLSALGPLTRIQKCLREKGALRTCSLKPEIRKLLLEKAAIRESEYTNNLAEALESLKAAQTKTKPGRESG